MNALLLIALTGCLLNQVISDSKISVDDFEDQKNLLKYWKALLNSDSLDLVYPSSISRNILRRSDRLNKRFDQNNLQDNYRMNNVHYEDELLPKSARNRKSDDPKIFRNLFLGARG